MNKLSERVRPNSEAAPWVVEEIKRLERQINSLQHWIDHYKSAIPKGENKIIEENYKFKEGISYALAQEANNYGMAETDAAQFRCRKVMSILSELLEDE